MPADRRLRLGDRCVPRGPDLRHDPARHHLRGLEPRLVQDLPRGHAAARHAGEPLRQAEGGRSMSTLDDTTVDATRASDTPVLELEDIGKSYGNVHALRGVNITVRQGEVTCVLGDNGAGKSTLIKIISGLHDY